MHNTEKLSYPEDYIFISTCFQSMYFTCRICQKISGFTEWQLYSLVLVGTEIKMPACILIKSCACTEYLRVLETDFSEVLCGFHYNFWNICTLLFCIQYVANPKSSIPLLFLGTLHQWYSCRDFIPYCLYLKAAFSVLLQVIMFVFFFFFCFKLLLWGQKMITARNIRHKIEKLVIAQK